MINLKDEYNAYQQRRIWLVKQTSSPQVKNFEKHLSPNSFILDAGCGSGVDTRFLRTKGHTVISVDIDSPYADILCSVENLPFRNECFDGIFCRGVLHLCHDRDAAIQEIRRVSKLGGLLFLSYPLDIISSGDQLSLNMEYDYAHWTQELMHKVRLVYHGTHQHHMRQLLLRNTTFSHAKRIFVETVSGCNNSYCTSKCAAYTTELTYMKPTTCASIIDYFRARGYKIALYGLGDCSSYPFQEIPTSLIGCIVNITSMFLERLPELHNLGLEIYVRTDRPEHIESLPPTKYFSGVFTVVGENERGIILSIARLALTKGLPLLVRSMCNKTDNLPIKLQELIEAIRSETGFLPYQVFSSTNLPRMGCPVTTIRETVNGLRVAKCLTHYSDYPVSNLGAIDTKIREWHEVGFEMQDFCFDCVGNMENYRVYYEPSSGR